MELEKRNIFQQSLLDMAGALIYEPTNPWLKRMCYDIFRWNPCYRRSLVTSSEHVTMVLSNPFDGQKNRNFHTYLNDQLLVRNSTLFWWLDLLIVINGVLYLNANIRKLSWKNSSFITKSNCKSSLRRNCWTWALSNAYSAANFLIPASLKISDTVHSPVILNSSSCETENGWTFLSILSKKFHKE